MSEYSEKTINELNNINNNIKSNLKELIILKLPQRK